MTSQSKNIRYIVSPGGRLNGTVRVPGDKSISHRAIMLGSLAEGRTVVEGFLEGEDALATLACFRAMGVRIDRPAAQRVVIEGVGLHGLKPPTAPLDCGNSGTSMRLLSGLLSGQRFNSELIGDASLTRRPMRRVTEPLAKMGARIESSPTGTPPLRITGGQSLRGLDYTLPVASAQVKSALLLAGLYAQGRTCITEPAPTRDHTERMLQAFGYPVEVNGARRCVNGGGRLQGTTIPVPADISSAAFFMVGAAIAAQSEVTLADVGMNPTRIGVINILRAMGADLQVKRERVVGGEPIADIVVRSSPLHGIRIPADQVPLAIDEFPALFVAAACAEGETILTGAEELRVKESDRIQVMADGLTTLGISAQPTPDGIRIQGGRLGQGTIESCGDHRIAMSFAMAALRASGTLLINDCANVATSFPGFVDLAQESGLLLQVEAV